MRSCPSDPEEEEEGWGYPCVPLTQPSGMGGSTGRFTKGQRSSCFPRLHMMMIVLLDEEADAGLTGTMQT